MPRRTAPLMISNTRPHRNQAPENDPPPRAPLNVVLLEKGGEALEEVADHLRQVGELALELVELVLRVIGQPLLGVLGGGEDVVLDDRVCLHLLMQLVHALLQLEWYIK